VQLLLGLIQEGRTRKKISKASTAVPANSYLKQPQSSHNFVEASCDAFDPCQGLLNLSNSDMLLQLAKGPLLYLFGLLDKFNVLKDTHKFSL
jgi:hypothetical protein